ncbi:hypothetical protein E1292_31655 [Nonomuraea deserti]|uniref:NTP pyrophosphohydrolase MazG putative catalytic core domain-containing protein n=1 Tax=Nonomuraea deserti TaxID=1848322 RepID=A0A4R4V4F3_9ACTN|nr:hypothetical protein [Nonomuraea deserti]TDC99490.1 hypothetical protein E1292_31655 [Nonomuraea deserti]
MQVPAGAALLDACAELGELAGAYLKHHDYRLDAPAGPHDQLPADVRAEYGDVLFAVLSFAAAAGIDAERELLQTLSRYEIRFGS